MDQLSNNQQSFTDILFGDDVPKDAPVIEQFKAWFSGSLFGFCGCTENRGTDGKVGEHSLCHRADVLVCRRSLQGGADVSHVRFAPCCDGANRDRYS